MSRFVPQLYEQTHIPNKILTLISLRNAWSGETVQNDILTASISTEYNNFIDTDTLLQETYLFKFNRLLLHLKLNVIIFQETFNIGTWT